MSSRTASQEAALKVLEQEIALAEQRGAERLRAEVRAVLDDRRRIVRLGEHQIEVVEVAAITDLLDGDSDGGSDTATE